MATQEKQPARPGAPLIRQSSLEEGTVRAGAFKWTGAAIVSVIFHISLFLSMWFLLPGPAPALQAENVQPQNEANVQAEAPPEPAASDPLTVTDIDPAAIEPDTDINYNNERKDEVSVPGLVNANEPVGIEGASKTAPPISLPLPPGLGGGQGGALAASFEGTISETVGSAGGYSLRGQTLAGTFFGRSGATKVNALREGGGTKESEATVAAGLTWLARAQSPDGRWMLDGRFPNPGQANDIAGTAFGLLPFLGAGKTHKASKDNPYDKPIERALFFLMRKQDRKTGNFGGGMYGHCLASIAMCEAYGLTQDPMLRRPAQMAVNYIVYAQHDGGGWRYGPNQAGDTSVSGWAIMALKSAKMSGLDVPNVSFQKAIRYLDTACNQTNEGYGYTGPSPTPTMSAVGLLCRQYLQSWGPQNIRMIRGIKNNVEPVPPPSTGGPNNMYYYYYSTQVMHHFGGDSWTRWNEKMRDSLIRTRDQSNNPLTRGSWDPSGDAHAAVGGRLMYTSLALLTLEVYYRHLPLYYREAGEKQSKLLSGPGS